MSVAPATASYHHGDLRRALLEATRELLVEGGIQAASLRAVARRAGVSNRAPYHHFYDKCALLAAVASEGFDKLCHDVEAALALSDDPATRITSIGLCYLRFARQNPGEFQVMFWHEICEGRNFPEREEKADRAFRYLLDAIDGMAAEPLAPEKTLSIAITVWSAVHGFATLRSQGAFDLDKVDVPLEEEKMALDLCSRITAAVASETASAAVSTGRR